MNEPLSPTVSYLSHELLGGEDEFVVDEPARPVLEQTAVRMRVYRLLVLHRLIRTARLREASRVVEEPGRHRLKHGENCVKHWKVQCEALFTHNEIKSDIKVNMVAVV